MGKDEKKTKSCQVTWGSIWTNVVSQPAVYWNKCLLSFVNIISSRTLLPTWLNKVKHHCSATFSPLKHILHSYNHSHAKLKL